MFKSYLDLHKINLSTQEMRKFNDFCEEKPLADGSFLGWCFFKFKTLFKDESLLTGILEIVGFNKLFSGKASHKSFHGQKNPEDNQQSFDDLSNYYGNLYRGSYVFNYFMGALAVLMALVPIGFSFEENFGENAHHYSLIFSAIELMIIAIILGIYKVGATPADSKKEKWPFPLQKWRNHFLNHRWHERWLDYRILAESFRYKVLLYPVDIDSLKHPGEQRRDNHSWVDVYFSFCLSTLEPEPKMDLITHKAYLLEIMEEQMKYHQANFKSSERIHHRLHSVASLLFFGTFFACFSHFFWHNPLLTLLSAFFPALAAAMHGILATGEFSKLALVSERMVEQIEDLIERLELLNKTPINPKDTIEAITKNFHDIVIAEALGWKAMFIDKNVPLA